MDVPEICREGRVRTRFQPIVRLGTGEVTGYEALGRGPVGELEDPRALFGRAAVLGLLADLDRACFAASAHHARFLPAHRGSPLLFVNVLPESILDPRFLAAAEEALERTGIAPSRVVLEVTEGQRVEDFALLRRGLDAFRERGFRIALDDMGAGHAGLQMFVEIEPDVVKLDRSLVRGVDRDPRRRSLLEAVAVVAQRGSLMVVAEGIETAEELRAVRALGIQCGQGFFLGRPGPAFPEVEPAALFVLKRSPDGGRAALDPAHHPFGESPIGRLARMPPTVPREMRVGEALEVLAQQGEEALVVVDGDRPWGVVQRGRLLEMLSRPFGRELYLRKPLEEVAETRLLVVDEAAGLGQVSKLVTARPGDEVYGHITVVSGERFRGLVSVRQLLDAVTDLRMESARYANPLTGLPGAPLIEAALRARLDGAGPVGVLHADLDDFKAFNDTYGFHRGDEAIRFTASLISEVLGGHGGDGAFLGHVGGDDFVAVVPGHAATRLAATIRDQFRARVGGLYPDVDRQRGYIVARSRRGETRRFPLMDISVASVVVEEGGERHYGHVLETLAAAKQRTKEHARLRRQVGG